MNKFAIEKKKFEFGVTFSSERNRTNFIGIICKYLLRRKQIESNLSSILLLSFPMVSVSSEMVKVILFCDVMSEIYLWYLFIVLRDERSFRIMFIKSMFDLLSNEYLI